MKKFKKVYIEVTNVCNLNCDFCPKTKRNKRFMNLEEVKTIISKFQNKGQKFYLHIMGEPLIHPDINNIISEFIKNNLSVNIVTNGTILENINTENLPSSLCVSLHSFSRNDIDLNLKDYLNKAIKYYNSVKDKNTFTELRLWNITKENINSIENQFVLSYLMNELKLDIDLIEYTKNFINEDNENSKKRKFNIKIKDKLYISMAKEFSWPNAENKECLDENGFCYGLRNQIGVLCDGSVVPCCLDSEGEITLGNIFIEDLEDILKSKRAKDMYNLFSENKISENLCKGCGYRKLYFNN